MGDGINKEPGCPSSLSWSFFFHESVMSWDTLFSGKLIKSSSIVFLGNEIIFFIADEDLWEGIFNKKNFFVKMFWRLSCQMLYFLLQSTLIIKTFGEGCNKKRNNDVGWVGTIFIPKWVLGNLQQLVRRNGFYSLYLLLLCSEIKQHRAITKEVVVFNVLYNFCSIKARIM